MRLAITDRLSRRDNSSNKCQPRSSRPRRFAPARGADYAEDAEEHRTRTRLLLGAISHDRTDGNSWRSIRDSRVDEFLVASRGWSRVRVSTDADKSASADPATDVVNSIFNDANLIASSSSSPTPTQLQMPVPSQTPGAR